MSVAPTCILNGSSIHVEKARALIDRISGELALPIQVFVTRRGEELPRLAARALDEKADPIVAGGGDGTVSAVAGAVAGTDAALAVLPMGTLNHFARDIGIPLDLEAAVRNLFTGQVTQVDVGEVNGRVFVNNSGTGPYPHIVRQREEQQRRGHPKWVAFMIALWAVMRRYSRLRLNLRLDGPEALARLTPFLFVGNNRYELKRLEIGRRMNLNAGRLWVCSPPPGNRRQLMRMALRGMTGRAGDRELHCFEAQEFWANPRTRRINVSTDGEVSVMDSPLHYRIRAGALRVVVPEEALRQRRGPRSGQQAIAH
jgi:diacylglycerol kinase family enzyme